MKERKYDLEERSEKFSLNTRDYCMQLNRDVINTEYIKQLIRSAGSVPSNYIEANESLGEKDKIMHIKICRKESKESRLWLTHTLTYDAAELENQKLLLIKESIELENIFSAIMIKLEQKLNGFNT